MHARGKMCWTCGKNIYYTLVMLVIIIYLKFLLFMPSMLGEFSLNNVLGGAMVTIKK